MPAFNSPPPVVQSVGEQGAPVTQDFLSLSLPSGARAVLPKLQKTNQAAKPAPQDTTTLLLCTLISPEAVWAREAAMLRLIAEADAHTARLGEILLAKEMDEPIRLAAAEVLGRIPSGLSKNILRRGSSESGSIGLKCTAIRIELGEVELAPNFAEFISSNIKTASERDIQTAVRALHADLGASTTALKNLLFNPAMGMETRSGACKLLGMLRGAHSTAALREALALESPLSTNAAIILADQKDPAAKILLLRAFSCGEGEDLINIGRAMRSYEWNGDEFDACELIPRDPSYQGIGHLLILADSAPPLAKQYIRGLSFEDAAALYEGLPLAEERLQGDWTTASRFINEEIWSAFTSSDLGLAMMDQLSNRFMCRAIAAHYNLVYGGRIDAAVQNLSAAAETAARPDDKEHLASYAAALSKAQARCIDNPFRLSPSLLIGAMSESRNDDRPLAVIVLPRADYNGAFNDLAPELDRLTRFYRIELFEAGGDSEMIASLKNAAHPGRGQSPARLLIIGGHGSRTSLTLGESDGALDNTADELDTSDFAALRAETIGECLEPGGKVVLLACSTGEGGTRTANLVNALAALMPKGVTVFGPQEPYYNQNLTLIVSADGELEDVHYGGVRGPFSPAVEPYRASAGSWQPWRAEAAFQPRARETP